MLLELRYFKRTFFDVTPPTVGSVTQHRQRPIVRLTSDLWVAHSKVDVNLWTTTKACPEEMSKRIAVLLRERLIAQVVENKFPQRLTLG